MRNGTSYIRKEDRSLLNRLRMTESLHSASLWNESDDNSHVLGIWKRGELISSMRLEVIEDSDHLEKKLELKLSEELRQTNKITFPVGILSHGVTAKEYSPHKLSAHLRYHLLKIARDVGIQHIFGILSKEATHREVLKDVGYEIYPHSNSLEMIYLNLSKNGQNVFRVCAKSATETLLLYPWIHIKNQ